jgi:multiple sugar transport system ATP-binding protein
MASVELRGVKKSYGAVEILHGIDLSIVDGEFVALVGPSGCGKSTLLRMIAGLEDTTVGNILIGGRDVTDLEPRKRDIAMVFQSYALYPHMTVAENMGFSLMLNGRPKTEIEQRVGEAARMLELTPLLDRRPAHLSGGQRQRVAMGRAVVRNPQVFLFDEPLSNLDAKLRVQMRAEIKSLHYKIRTTAVYVTHDQIEAMTLADRVVVMNKGRIEQAGSPMELYREPDNLFVAGFIGSPSMNFLEGILDGENGQAAIRLPDGQALPLAADFGARGKAVTVGLRPEHLGFSDAGALTGTACVIEPTGAETHVVFDLAGTRVTAVVDGESTIAVDEKLKTGIDANKIYLFDRADGKRLRSRTA